MASEGKMLRKAVLEATARATASQALKKITTGHELLPAGPLGVRYVLFSADLSQRKPKSQPKDAPKPAFRDPFAAENLEQDLFVSRIHDEHNLVLNKFCVVEEHVVLPTIDFKPQEEPLTVQDLRAMWTAMAGLDGFAFFNCGYESGASQPHKHMQLNSYPSFKQFTGLDMPPLLHFIDEKLRAYPKSETVHLPELPFLHFLHRIDISLDVDSQVAADRLHEIYSKVMGEMNGIAYPKIPNSNPDPNSTLPIAYNLLLTSSFLFVIPRKTQAFEGIEVNSIGFIGSFFVRDDAQRSILLADGPMELLRRVTFPPALVSEL